MPAKPGRWCPKCKRSHKGDELCPLKKPWSTGKASGKGRGGRAWQRKRQRIFERDDYLCQEHKRQGVLRPVELHGSSAGRCDHIVPLDRGGADEDDNLQTLCKACHDIKTQQESIAARGRGV